MRGSASGDVQTGLRDRLALVMLLSGPPVLLGLQVAIYEETIAWAWAFASLFVALAFRALTDGQGLPLRTLAAMAAMAGLCLLTRPTTALGLYASLALLMVWQLVRRDAQGPGPLARLVSARILVPALIAAAFIGVAGFVNWARWGNPFTAADMQAQLHYLEVFPERLTRLDQYGLFNIRRLFYGVLYFVFPIWLVDGDPGIAPRAQLHALFDAQEFPITSILLTDPFVVLLSVAGMVGLLRGRIGALPRTETAMLALGLCVAPILMMTAWYMTFRYRAEFAPLLLVLSCCGAAALAGQASAWSPGRRSAAAQIFAALFILQILSAHLHGLMNGMMTRGFALHHLDGSNAGAIYLRCLHGDCPRPD